MEGLEGTKLLVTPRQAIEVLRLALSRCFDSENSFLAQEWGQCCLPKGTESVGAGNTTKKEGQLRCDLGGGIAPAALTAGADGGDSEPISACRCSSQRLWFSTWLRCPREPSLSRLADRRSVHVAANNVRREKSISPLQGLNTFLAIGPRGVAPGYYISRLQREKRALADARASAPSTQTDQGLTRDSLCTLSISSTTACGRVKGI